ncbi:M56 family metallopeptidase [Porcincola intestinalis]|uniref:M56 family metallopeptidase n=1 Tax=Porcincola intestinalis TaxID=2606632 RepID=A0A6L5X8T6_9FIRM|nr:M56 family metallopeptidase [Porcincola intestinalis]MSS15416.1 M56 family metallopeptidase [Porcincola intestinalis]
MNLLFTMSLAGVIPLVPYYFLKATGICTGIQLRRLLKLSIFFFLCPIQVLKYIFPFKFPAFMYQLSNKIYLKREGYTIIKMYDGSYYPVPNWMLIIAIVWTATVICIATIYSLKYRKFKTLLLEKSNPVPEKQIDITIYSNHSAHIHCNISTLIRTPFVIGILTPEIFLPDTKLTEEELSMVLLHETAHVRYKDLLYKSLCFVICLIHWFNPFAWLLLQEYADVSEIVCDECVIHTYTTKEQRKRYATFLLQSITEGEYIADCSITKQYDFSNTDTIFISGSEESSHNNELMKNSVIEEQYNFSVFNEIFIEESGKQRAVLSGNEQRKALCRHSFISGFIVRHIKNHKGDAL